MPFVSSLSHRFGPLPSPVLGWQRASASARVGQSRLVGMAVLAGVTVLALVALTPSAQRAALLTWLLMAPLCEEAFFRGLLHEALLRRLAQRGAIANGLVALAFGALHAATRGLATGMAVILPALLIGQAYGRSRRLLPAVALHASFNLAWLAWGRPGAALLASGASVAPDLLSILQEWFA